MDKNHDLLQIQCTIQCTIQHLNILLYIYRYHCSGPWISHQSLSGFCGYKWT